MESGISHSDLSLRYLGISLGYALSLGLILALGTLIPPMLDGRLKIMIDSSGGNILIAGVAVAIFGIALSGIAGYMKDKIVTRGWTNEGKSGISFRKGESSRPSLSGSPDQQCRLGWNRAGLLPAVLNRQGLILYSPLSR